MPAQDPSWEEFAQSYRDELPEILHPHVERLLAANGVTDPTVGEVTETDQAIREETAEETTLEHWRRLYGEDVTEEEANLFAAIDASIDEIARDKGVEIGEVLPDGRRIMPDLDDFALGGKTGDDPLVKQWEVKHKQESTAWQILTYGEVRLSNASAHFLLDRGMKNNIWARISSGAASGLEQDIAEALIMPDHEAYVRDMFYHPEVFEDKFGSRVAGRLADIGKPSQIFEHEQLFEPGAINSDVALRIIAKDDDPSEPKALDRGQPWNTSFVVNRLRHFDELDDRVMEKIIQASDKFSEATDVLNTDLVNTTVDHLQVFKGLSEK